MAPKRTYTRKAALKDFPIEHKTIKRRPVEKLTLKKLPKADMYKILDNSFQVETNNTFDKLLQGEVYNLLKPKAKINNTFESSMNDSSLLKIKVTNTEYAPVIKKRRTRRAKVAVQVNAESHLLKRTLDKTVDVSLSIWVENPKVQVHNMTFVSDCSQQSCSIDLSSINPCTTNSLTQGLLLRSGTEYKAKVISSTPFKFNKIKKRKNPDIIAVHKPQLLETNNACSLDLFNVSSINLINTDTQCVKSQNNFIKVEQLGEEQNSAFDTNPCNNLSCDFLDNSCNKSSNNWTQNEMEKNCNDQIRTRPRPSVVDISNKFSQCCIKEGENDEISVLESVIIEKSEILNSKDMHKASDDDSLSKIKCTSPRKSKAAAKVNKSNFAEKTLDRSVDVSLSILIENPNQLHLNNNAYVSDFLQQSCSDMLTIDGSSIQPSTTQCNPQVISSTPFKINQFGKRNIPNTVALRKPLTETLEATGSTNIDLFDVSCINSINSDEKIFIKDELVIESNKENACNGLSVEHTNSREHSTNLLDNNPRIMIFNHDESNPDGVISVDNNESFMNVSNKSINANMDYSDSACTDMLSCYTTTSTCNKTLNKSIQIRMQKEVNNYVTKRKRPCFDEQRSMDSIVNANADQAKIILHEECDVSHDILNTIPVEEDKLEFSNTISMVELEPNEVDLQESSDGSREIEPDCLRMSVTQYADTRKDKTSNSCDNNSDIVNATLDMSFGQNLSICNVSNKLSQCHIKEETNSIPCEVSILETNNDRTIVKSEIFSTNDTQGTSIIVISDDETKEERGIANDDIERLFTPVLCKKSIDSARGKLSNRFSQCTIQAVRNEPQTENECNNPTNENPIPKDNIQGASNKATVISHNLTMEETAEAADTFGILPTSISFKKSMSLARGKLSNRFSQHSAVISEPRTDNECNNPTNENPIPNDNMQGTSNKATVISDDLTMEETAEAADTFGILPTSISFKKSMSLARGKLSNRFSQHSAVKSQPRTDRIQEASGESIVISDDLTIEKASEEADKVKVFPTPISFKQLSLTRGKWRRSLCEYRRTSMFKDCASPLPIIINKSIAVSAKDIVLQRCGQTAPEMFEKFYCRTMNQVVRKIGEGVYGEVFLCEPQEGKSSVIKVIPIEGDEIINGERQKKFDEIISEIVVAMELSNLRSLNSNSTTNFSEVIKVACLKGRYPCHLINLWNAYDERKKSENDSPTIFKNTQLYIILELANGGTDLESFVFNNAWQALSAFKQIAYSLAVAERALEFEHRDLHWGNVLISKVDKREIVSFLLDGETIEVCTNGVQVSIIDFTLSRISFAGDTIFNDLSNDPELFQASGDYQFEIYKLMQVHTGNNWNHFKPYTNILWLHYVLQKMIHEVRYKYIKTKLHHQHIKLLRILYDDILKYSSVTEFVTCANLY